MAQSGFTPIQLYYSATAAAAPIPGNLASGELAINITDGKLYYKDNLGAVQTIADKAYSTRVTTISFGSTGLTPSTATSGAVTVAGTLNVANGGTGQTSFSNGELLIGNSSGNTLTKATLTAGSGVTITNGNGSITIAASGGGGGVTTFSAGTTGLTPSTATSGAVTLAGTLNVSNGGTGLTTYTSGGVLYASGSGTLANGTGLTFSSSNLGVGVASPFFKLDVGTTSGAVTPYIASFVNTNTSTAQANLLRITQGDPGAAVGYLGTFGTTYTSSSFAGTFGVGSLGSNPLVFATNNSVRIHVDVSGNAQLFAGAVMQYSPAPASISTASTLSNSDIQSQIINTTGTSYTVTMPTGTTLESLANWAASNISYDFAVINTASGTITIAANTNVTTLGSLTISTGDSAQFRIRRTSANNFVLYRLS